MLAGAGRRLHLVPPDRRAAAGLSRAPLGIRCSPRGAPWSPPPDVGRAEPAATLLYHHGARGPPAQARWVLLPTPARGGKPPALLIAARAVSQPYAGDSRRGAYPALWRRSYDRCVALGLDARRVGRWSVATEENVPPEAGDLRRHTPAPGRLSVVNERRPQEVASSPQGGGARPRLRRAARRSGGIGGPQPRDARREDHTGPMGLIELPVTRNCRRRARGRPEPAFACDRQVGHADDRCH